MSINALILGTNTDTTWIPSQNNKEERLAQGNHINLQFRDMVEFILHNYVPNDN